MPSILLTPPAGEPVSLAEAKDFLRVTHGDDDQTIGALITGARVHVEMQTRRALITQTWRLTRDLWPATGVLRILPAPLRDLLAVRVFDGEGEATAVDIDAFVIDRAAAPAILAFAQGTVPTPGQRAAGIEIDIETGYGDAASDVPEPLRHAVRLLTAHWYENRAIVAASGEIAAMPAAVGALIAPYRVFGL